MIPVLKPFAWEDDYNNYTDSDDDDFSKKKLSDDHKIVMREKIRATSLSDRILG